MADASVCLEPGVGSCQLVRFGAVAGAGEACGAVGTDADGVVTIVACADDLVCDRVQGLCVVAGGLGESCVGSSCQPPLYCDAGTCRQPELLEPASVGSACVPGDVCDYQLGTACVEGTCTSAGSAEGAPCDERWIGYRAAVGWCDPPFVCDGASGVCLRDAVRADGEDCSFDEECGSGCCAVSGSLGMCRRACAPSDSCVG